MTGHVKVSGAWKELARPFVKVAGAWKGVDAAYVKVGGAWKSFFENLTVAADTTSVSKLRATGSLDVYALLAYNADGYEYNNTPFSSGTANNQLSTWLEAGSSSDVWVERTINSGTLDFDAGAGRLNLGTTRLFGVQQLDGDGSGVALANVTFNFYDAASGGNLLDSITVSFSAEIL